MRVTLASRRGSRPSDPQVTGKPSDNRHGLSRTPSMGRTERETSSKPAMLGSPSRYAADYRIPARPALRSAHAGAGTLARRGLPQAQHDPDRRRTDSGAPAR